MRARQVKLHRNRFGVSATKVGGTPSRLTVEVAAGHAHRRDRATAAGLGPESRKCSAASTCCVLAASISKHACCLQRYSAHREWPAQWWNRRPLSKMSRRRGRRAGRVVRRQGQEMRAGSASLLPPAELRACVRPDQCRWRAAAPSAAHPSQACGRSGRDRGYGSDRRRR